MFPNSRYIVTTRPAAVEEGWLSDGDSGLTDWDLLPMSADDAKSFIDHWHASAALGYPEEERTSVLDDANRLKATTEEDVPHLRAFLQNPLLCAMLCALHRERRSALPKYRTELYRIALEALLDRRDRERHVPGSALALDRSEKEHVLQGLAWWLVANGRAALPRDVALEIVANRIKSLPQVEADADDVLSDLIVRSGVLREPVPANLDFAHKTFQEYFAAHEILEQQLLELLVEHAGDQSWREVVLMSAGLARGRLSTRLINALLDITQGVSTSVALQATTIAALEAVQDLDEETTNRLRATVDSFLPPQSHGVADALAFLGDDIVPRLERTAAMAEHVAEASVHCLVAIGSPRAFAALATYAGDERVAVAQALLEGWPRFELETYAETVLAQTRFAGDAVTIAHPRFLAAVRHLQHVQVVTCDFLEASPADLRTLDELRSVSVLRVGLLTDGISLDVAGGQRDLGLLWIEKAPRLEWLWSNELPALEELRLDDAPRLDLDGVSLASLAPAVRDLRLGYVKMPTAAPLQGLQRLRWVHLTETSTHDVSKLAGVPALECIQLERLAALRSIPDLRGLERLTSLDVVNCGTIRGENLSHLPSSLERLRLTSTQISELDQAEHLDALHDVDLENCHSLTNLAALSQMPALAKVNIAGTSTRSVEDLANLVCLRTLRCDHTLVGDVDCLSDNPLLTRASLRGCMQVTHGQVIKLARLEELDIGECGKDFEIGALAALTHLRALTVSTLSLSSRAVRDLAKCPRLAELRIAVGEARWVGGVDFSPLVDKGVTILPDAQDQID